MADLKSNMSSNKGIHTNKTPHDEIESNFTKSDYVLLAQLACQTERFDDMINFVNKFTLLSSPNVLSEDERYYFTTAYKNAVGNRRAELRLLTSIELKEQRNQKTGMIGQKLNKYKKKIETELVDLCRGLIKIVDENLLMNSKHPENMIYYTKMKADYMR